MTRAAIYCRISKDKNRSRQTVQAQEADCRDQCELNGWTVDEADVFVDNSISASDPSADRKEYTKMMRALARGGIDLVVVTMADRLHRQPSELEDFISDYLNAGMSVVSTVRSGEFDLRNPNGLYNFRQEGNSAEREVGILKLRVNRGLKRRANAGLWHGGGRPFGYESDGVTINDAEARRIREATDKVLEGSTLYSICQDWTANDITTVKGKRWAVPSLKRILISPRIAGLLQYQGEILGDAEWPGIVKQEKWEQVRTMLMDPTRQTPHASSEYPLRGILECSECGRLLQSKKDHGKRAYACRADQGGCNQVHISAPGIEKYLFGKLLPLVDHPDLHDQIRAEEAADHEEIVTLVEQRTKYQAKIEELDEMFAEDEINRQTYIKQVGKLHAKVDDITSRLTGIRGQSALDRLGGEVQANWNGMSADDKRSIIKSLVNKVVVFRAKRPGVFDPGRINIHWCFETLKRLEEFDYVTSFSPDGRVLSFSAFTVDDNGVFKSAMTRTSAQNQS